MTPTRSDSVPGAYCEFKLADDRLVHAGWMSNERRRSWHVTVYDGDATATGTGETLDRALADAGAADLLADLREFMDSATRRDIPGFVAQRFAA